MCRGLPLLPGTPCHHGATGSRGVDREGDDPAGPVSLDAIELPTSTMTQDYVKAVYNQEEWGPEGASTSELAARMGVGASTVSENVGKLAAAGLVHHEPYGRITLTSDGRRIALAMVRRHRLVETYLSQALGYGWDEVHDDAEVLEHAVSETLLTRMDEVLGHPDRDPHGDPIPQADGTVRVPPAHRLDEVAPGGRGRIARISDAEPSLLREIAALGLDLDEEVEAGALPLSAAATGVIWVVARSGRAARS